MWRDDWREKLSEYRQGIDEIDVKVLELVGKRMELSEKIGEIKSELGLPICVPEREAEVLGDRRNAGRVCGLREEFVKVLFELVMLESKRIQSGLVNA
jgi:chorismate mutase/prephenate dehydrogenase